MVLAGLIAEGPTRGLLLGHYDLQFYTPQVVVIELERHLGMVARRTGKPREIVEVLVHDLLANVEIVATAGFAAMLPSARERARSAHAAGDEEYIALAEALSAPVWTYDRDFRRVRGLQVLTTAEVARLAHTERPSGG